MMKRLTTDTPNGNFETMLNFVYGKDGWAHIRHDGEHEDVLLTDWAKRQCLLHGCDEVAKEGPDDIDLQLCDCMMDNPICPIAMAYCFAIQAVHLRDRLKMYEDTGLGPDEITTEPYGCVFYCNRKCNLDGDFCAEGPGCPQELDAGTAKHLLEFAQAEKSGRLVVLPCKVGDTVYLLRDGKIFVAIVECIHQWSSGVWKLNAHTDKRYTHWFGYEVSFDDFGKTTFMTREDAEAALKTMEAEN